MRTMMVVVFLTALTTLTSQSGEKEKSPFRFGVDRDVKRYPQDTPKAALGSVVKAIAEKRFDYLLAYLADPAFVEQRIQQNMASLGKELTEAQKVALAFDRLIKTTAESFKEDPSKMTDLRRFHEEGEWQESGDDAVASLKALPARKVFMRKVAPDRWVLLDKTK